MLSRGDDDVIVDPSPYGSQSTLTGNAPTVRPRSCRRTTSRARACWSESPASTSSRSAESGVVAARCDYSDAYKFQERTSDVPDALRDFVLIPSADGTDAALVVLDRANTGGDDRDLYLRFRTPGTLALAGDDGDRHGRRHAARDHRRCGPRASPRSARRRCKDCFKEGTVRGTCDAARFPITDYRVELPGPKPTRRARDRRDRCAPPSPPRRSRATATRACTSPARATPRHLAHVAATATLAYTAPPGLHVVLDAGDRDGHATVDREAGARTAAP